MDGGCARLWAGGCSLPRDRRAALGNTRIAKAVRGDSCLRASPAARRASPPDRSLPDEHVTIEAGIPVTTLERTLLDTAARLDVRQLEHDLVEADRSRRLRWPKLWQVITEHGRGRKGAKRLRRVAAGADPRFADAVSTSEVDFLILCREEGLKMPQVNVLVEGKRVDFYWPKERLIVEADSYGFHGDPTAFEKDHQSTVDLEVAGYRVHRTTYKMLQANPSPFLNLVRSSLTT
jgi:very-short-patch-repair endonuclease